MTADTVGLEDVDKIIDELFSLDGFIKKKFADGNSVSEKDVAEFEKAIGGSLPAGYRSYILKYGLGGPLLRDDVTRPRNTLELKESALVQAKAKFGYKRSFITKDGKQKQSITRIEKGTNGAEGTLHLGCPTGTHVNFHLVLNGPYAGEIWKGNFSLVPSKKPMFLSMTVAFLKKELIRARRQSKLGRKLLEGKLEELLAKKEGKPRGALINDLRSAVKNLLVFHDLSESDYDTILSSLQPLRFKNRVPIMMMQGRWEEVEKLVKEKLAEATNSHAQKSCGLNIVFAMAVRGELAPADTPVPTDGRYGLGQLNSPLLIRRVFGTLHVDAQTLVKKQVNKTWSDFLERS